MSRVLVTLRKLKNFTSDTDNIFIVDDNVNDQNKKKSPPDPSCSADIYKKKMLINRKCRREM